MGLRCGSVDESEHHRRLAERGRDVHRAPSDGRCCVGSDVADGAVVELKLVKASTSEVRGGKDECLVMRARNIVGVDSDARPSFKDGSPSKHGGGVAKHASQRERRFRRRRFRRLQG